MNSIFLWLNKKDLVNGLIIAVLGTVAGTINTAIQVGNFDVSSYDWLGILRLAGSAAGLYLLKKLLTDKNGDVLGRWGGN